MTYRFALALVLGTAATILAAPPARAQPLAEFLAAGRTHNLDLAEQQALIRQSEAQADVERGALLPTLTAQASYTRNQFDTIVQIPRMNAEPIEAPIVPQNQLDALVTLNVPIIDLGARRRAAAARALTDSTRASADALAAEVDRAIVRAYYQWVGGAALVLASQKALETAVDNQAVVENRSSAGLASTLDVERARAEVARARAAIADAELAVATARRQLTTLTGLTPAANAPTLPETTAAEADLDSWLGRAAQAPEVRAAEASRRAAEVRTNAARMGWLPTVSAFASERITNAAGFGESMAWAAGVTATWRVDLATPSRIRLEAAGETAGAVRAARAAQDARDRITDAWNQVASRRVRAEAAMVEVAAAQRALDVATTRFDGGTATQLEVVQAQRDVFSAAVAVVQARADLAAARALLRLAANQEVAP